MRKFLKKLALWSAISFGALAILALATYLLLWYGTPGLEYKTNSDGTCYVSGICKADVEHLRIPARSPKGRKVVGIGAGAFQNCDSIKTVTLPHTLESIASDAFYNCDGLICTQYGNAYYVGSKVNPYRILLKVTSTSIAECEIHPDTRFIYGSAFSGCESLERISIPEGVVDIGPYSFAWCASLEEIELPNGLKTISEYAFLGCQSIEKIEIPSAVRRIERWAFAMCGDIESVIIASSSRISSIGDYAFYGCERLKGIDLFRLKRLESIGYAAFAGCTSLSDVTAPRRAIAIGDASFLGCDFENYDLVMQYAKMPTDKVYTRDVPQNLGVLNTIIKANQLKNVSFYTENSIPLQVKDVAVGKTHTGLPYSSSRIENLFVPNFVSLYSFMTSTRDPNSYLYSIDIGEEGNVNGDTYYGAVCSTYCSYALGIDGMYTTHQWTSIPDMIVLEHRSIDSMMLGDTIVGNAHVLIVTDIERDAAGSVNEITIMDIATAGVREREFTRIEFTSEYIREEYTFCRYGKISESTLQTTRFAAMMDKNPKTFNYNEDIIPRKGDRSNWLYGQDVEIDVLNTEDYRFIEVYLGDSLVSRLNITDMLVIEMPEAGSYKARLVGDEKSSDFCYWMVVDARSRATPSMRAKCVDVEFSASNAVPLFIVWQEAKENGAKNVHIFTPEEAQSGLVTAKYAAGEFKIRVAFKTEYGIIFSDLPEAIWIK